MQFSRTQDSMQVSRTQDSIRAAEDRSEACDQRQSLPSLPSGNIGATVTAITASRAGHSVQGGSVSTAGIPDAPISVVERISLILETFNGTGPLTLVEVTRRTGLPRSSVHRLLDQLTSTGWLAREEQTYELGVKAYEIGRSAFNQNRLLQQATPVMRRLAHTVGLTVHLGVVDHGDVIYMASVHGHRSPSAATAIGSRVPAHLTALGKAIIANYSEERLSDIYSAPLQRATAHSVGSRRQLDADLAGVRQHGVAFDHQELAIGISCVGVALGPPDHYYGNRAAISVFGPSNNIELSKLAGPVRVAAAEIWDRCVASHLPTHQFENWRPPSHGFQTA
ncbi:IclR family transcriptional regulator [Williamsia limnetica]|uniref:IclR family transcriptional regulator n=1 Tax=Williamsia limnetica TaxID=882452 RepID=A0A318RDF3_WILLI|nr:IclR family transcriptional regulator [Williamsia limnetica]